MIRYCIVCNASFTPEMVLEQGRLRPRRRQTCSLHCLAELQRRPKEPVPASKNPSAAELQERIRIRGQQIAAAVRNPQIEQLRSQLAFYEKRGIRERVWELTQRIYELGGRP